MRDGAGLLRHKRKDDDAHGLPLYYSWSTLGNGLGALRDISLKQARECTLQWRFISREDSAPLKGTSIFFIHNSKYANYSLNSNKYFEFYSVFLP